MGCGAHEGRASRSGAVHAAVAERAGGRSCSASASRAAVRSHHEQGRASGEMGSTAMAHDGGAREMGSSEVSRRGG